MFKVECEGCKAPYQVDEAVLEVLVTAFRDLRTGHSVEGWAVERPGTVMSTAEAKELGAQPIRCP